MGGFEFFFYMEQSKCAVAISINRKVNISNDDDIIYLQNLLSFGRIGWLPSIDHLDFHRKKFIITLLL